jgi:hypothetical protein
MSAKYIPIKEVVAEFLDQYDKSEGDFDKAFVMAWRGYENMHYNTTAEPKTVRLPVQANKIVYVPADYVAWVKIGILNNNGEISTLKVNNSLTTFRDLHSNRLSLLSADINDGWIGNMNAPYFNYFNNGLYQTFYGAGNAGVVTFGDCRVDEENNVIVLDPNFGYSSIMFEYISSPKKDSDYLVDVRLREALIAFIAWKFKLDSRENFYAAQVEARRMIKPFKMQTFEQVIRENERMTLKV